MEKNKEVSKKLSYEQLENVARQISAQLDNCIKENTKLKASFRQAEINNMFTEISFRFKVLECASFFSPSFIEKCVKDIEDIMTETPSDNNEKNVTEEDKKDGQQED